MLHYLMNNYYIGQILGYITAGVNFILYMPQVIHVYKVKDTNSLDSKFLLLQMLSCITTCSYGFIIKEYPIIISSISIFASTASLGYAKWYLFKTNDINTNNINTKYEYESINEIKSIMHPLTSKDFDKKKVICSKERIQV